MLMYQLIGTRSLITNPQRELHLHKQVFTSQHLLFQLFMNFRIKKMSCFTLGKNAVNTNLNTIVNHFLYLFLQCNASAIKDRESVLPHKQFSSNSTVFTLTLDNTKGILDLYLNWSHFPRMTVPLVLQLKNLFMMSTLQLFLKPLSSTVHHTVRGNL